MADPNKLPFTFSANFNTHSQTTDQNVHQQLSDVFSIAMMGNFSGKQMTSEKSNIEQRNFIAIDRYNYDEVFASMGLQLTLILDKETNSKVLVPLASLKDFHPDTLYKNVAVFGQLRDLRRRLNNPATFNQAVEEMGGFQQQEQDLAFQEPVTETDLKPQVTEDSSEQPSRVSFLDSIMQETKSRAVDNSEISKPSPLETKVNKSAIDGLIQKLVGNQKGGVSRDARQNEMVAAIDETITLQMSNLLHHPQFQALESAWRAVHFMVKRLPNDTSLKLYLLDVSHDDIASDLDTNDVTQSQLYKLFVDTSMGDINWSLIVGDYRFGPDIDDILMLSQLGAIAQQAGAQFMAAADEKLVGCKAFAETSNVNKWLYKVDPQLEDAWTMLRKSAVAKSISLALPRFVLRQPYGSKLTPVKSFAFEEMSQPPEHEDYLWGNPAFLKAEQIARCFLKTGWKMQYTNVFDTQDLPVHYYEENGRTVVKPCAEIPLTEIGASQMIAKGLIPLWSFKDGDKIHSENFHSIAE
jgi:type VI secretion system protein ImpC